MRGRHLALIALGLAGCGGSSEEIALGLTGSEIPANVTFFRIGFHASTRTCEKVLSEPGVAGTINIEADTDALKAGLSIDSIPPGKYIVAAIGSTGPGAPPLVAGCVENVDIKEGQRNKIEIAIAPRR